MYVQSEYLSHSSLCTATHSVMCDARVRGCVYQLNRSNLLTDVTDTDKYMYSKRKYLIVMTLYSFASCEYRI